MQEGSQVKGHWRHDEVTYLSILNARLISKLCHDEQTNLIVILANALQSTVFYGLFGNFRGRFRNYAADISCGLQCNVPYCLHKLGR